MIVGDLVRTPAGWTGTIVRITRQRRGPGGEVYWVSNGAGETHAFSAEKLTFVPRFAESSSSGQPKGEP